MRTGSIILSPFVVCRVKPGNVLTIPIGAEHGLRAVTDLEFIEVQMGSDLVEENIVRIYNTKTPQKSCFCRVFVDIVKRQFACKLCCSSLHGFISC